MSLGVFLCSDVIFLSKWNEMLDALEPTQRKWNEPVLSSFLGELPR